MSSALGRSLAKPDRIRKLFDGMRRPESPRRPSSRLLTPHHREGETDHGRSSSTSGSRGGDHGDLNFFQSEEGSRLLR